jgi:small-conductance mechanosensitive channel
MRDGTEHAPLLGEAIFGAVGSSVGAAITIGVAIAITWVLQRASRATAFQRVHRWLPALQVALWLVVGSWIVLPRLVDAEREGQLVVIGVILVLAFAALPWLRNVFAGFVCAIEGEFAIGDDIRVGDVDGRIVRIGVRAATVRARDGTEISVPWSALQSRSVAALALDALDAPCEFIVSVPRTMTVDEALEAGRTAAATSAFASPRVTPEVFVVIDTPTPGAPPALLLRVRGYVFDRDHEERYRSDVSARLAASFAVTGHGDA